MEASSPHVSVPLHLVKTYEITGDRDEVVIRFDRRLVDREALSELLDYVEAESIRQQSAMTEEQAGALADDVDRAVWEQVEHRYAEE
jgi:hypothetical protein